MRLIASLCLAAAALLFASGCKSPQARVEKEMHTLRALWQTNVQYHASLPEKTLDWSAARAQLLAHNIKLRQARLEMTNAQESVRQIFRDLTPTLNLRSGVSKRLEDISNMTMDDVTFSADSFFNIPGLLSFSARLYAARLMQFRAETAYALVEREQIIELYKIFQNAETAQLQSGHLGLQRRTAEMLQQVDPFSGGLLLTDTRVREMADVRDREALQQRASELLGSRDFRWFFAQAGLPALPYETEPLPLTDTNRVAQLQMKWYAIELESARAQLQGIKLRYLPELSIFVSGPPIYQRSSGQDRFWDSGDVRASADLFWYLDTRGYISRQVRQTKRQHTLQKERMRQESLALIDRLVLTQTLLQEALAQSEQIDRQLEIMRAVPPAQNFASLQKYAEDYRALVEQQRILQRDTAELKTIFWFVDDRAWPADNMLQASL